MSVQALALATAHTMTRTQAMATARRMAEGDWQIKEIQTYLASRGHAMSWDTIKSWSDPEWAERRRAYKREYRRRWWRETHDVTRFGVLDADARARLAEHLDAPELAQPTMTEDLMHTLRVEDGLSYNAIAKVAGRIYGTPMTGEKVRYLLAKRGVPKNEAKVRNARRQNAARAAA